MLDLFLDLSAVFVLINLLINERNPSAKYAKGEITTIAILFAISCAFLFIGRDVKTEVNSL